MSRSINIPGLAVTSLTLSDKAAVVLDIGRAYTKVGYAGEHAPRVVIASCVHDIYDIAAQTPVFDTNRSYELNLHMMRKFLLHIYFEHLLSMGKDRRVLVVENVLLPTTMRQIIARTLFESLEVGCVHGPRYTLQSPCVLFAPAPLMACVPMRAPTALVVDCGHIDTVLVPVVNGICDLHRWQTAVGARELILHRLRTLLVAFATVHKQTKDAPEVVNDWHHLLTENHLEDIYVRTCFVTTRVRGQQLQHFEYVHSTTNKADMALLPQPSVGLVRYPLDSVLTMHIPGFVRELLAEAMFVHTVEQSSLAHAVLDVLVKSARDERKALASNLLLVGGLAQTAGLHERLLHELVHAKNEYYRDKLFFADDTFKFIRFPTTCAPVANMIAWIGGSVCASTDVLSMRAITAQQWLDNNRSISDWCAQTNTTTTPFVQPTGVQTFNELQHGVSPAQAHALKRAASQARVGAAPLTANLLTATRRR